MNTLIEKKSVDDLQRLNVEAYKRIEKIPVLIVLDNVRSAYNVGSIFRTSDAFKIEKVYLCGITAKGENREVLKTALGATQSVDWEHVEDIQLLLLDLKRKNNTLWAVEQAHSSIKLQSISQIPYPLVLIFGNEINGVNKEALALCDSCIEIPQFGTKHSLNISVSVGIVLWHITFISSQILEK